MRYTQTQPPEVKIWGHQNLGSKIWGQASVIRICEFGVKFGVRLRLFGFELENIHNFLNL